MFTYEYHCVNCNKDFAISCPCRDRDNQHCPDCGELLRRAMIPSGLKILIPERLHTSWEDYTNPDEKKMYVHGPDTNQHTVKTYGKHRD